MSTLFCLWGVERRASGSLGCSRHFLLLGFSLDRAPHNENTAGGKSAWPWTPLQGLHCQAGAHMPLGLHIRNGRQGDRPQHRYDSVLSEVRPAQAAMSHQRGERVFTDAEIDDSIHMPKAQDLGFSLAEIRNWCYSATARPVQSAGPHRSASSVALGKDRCSLKQLETDLHGHGGNAIARSRLVPPLAAQSSIRSPNPPEPEAMTIEILYFGGCPNYLPAVERVREALQVECASAEIKHVEVSDTADAATRGFLGSPTIRINGVDVEPSARFGSVVGMCCRTYTVGGARDGAPSTELICQAIRQLGSGRQGNCCA